MQALCSPEEVEDDSSKENNSVQISVGWLEIMYVFLVDQIWASSIHIYERFGVFRKGGEEAAAEWWDGDVCVHRLLV